MAVSEPLISGHGETQKPGANDKFCFIQSLAAVAGYDGIK
jgi:hypothetical protein